MSSFKWSKINIHSPNASSPNSLALNFKLSISTILPLQKGYYNNDTLNDEDEILWPLPLIWKKNDIFWFSWSFKMKIANQKYKELVLCLIKNYELVLKVVQDNLQFWLLKFKIDLNLFNFQLFVNNHNFYCVYLYIYIINKFLSIKILFSYITILAYITILIYHNKWHNIVTLKP